MKKIKWPRLSLGQWLLWVHLMSHQRLALHVSLSFIMLIVLVSRRYVCLEAGSRSCVNRHARLSDYTSSIGNGRLQCIVSSAKAIISSNRTPARPEGVMNTHDDRTCNMKPLSWHLLQSGLLSQGEGVIWSSTCVYARDSELPRIHFPQTKSLVDT